MCYSLSLGNYTFWYHRLKPSLHFVSWNQEGWKTGLCSVPPVGHSHSLLALANNTCVKPTFIELKDRFMKLYKKKVQLCHHCNIRSHPSLASHIIGKRALLLQRERLKVAAQDFLFVLPIKESFQQLLLKKSKPFINLYLPGNMLTFFSNEAVSDRSAYEFMVD